MGEKISRREFARLAALAAAAVGAPGALAQQKPDEEVERVLAEVERKLAEPLSDEARAIARTMIRGNLQAARGRLGYKLPENSEPCFLYVAQPRAAKP